MRISQNRKKHNILYIILLAGVILLYLINLCLVSISIIDSIKVPPNRLVNFTGLNLSEQLKIFPKSIVDLTNKYYIDITPTDLFFPIIWTIIYIYQLLWLIYAVVCLFRRQSGRYLFYRTYDNIHFMVLLAFGINILLSMCWLFTWSFGFKTASFLMATAQSIALFVAFFISVKRLYLNKNEMFQFELGADVWLARILIHNGLAFYLTWLIISSNIHFAIFLSYTAQVGWHISSTVGLSTISAFILAYFVVENFVWQRYLLHVFTPWIVIIFFLISGLIKNWQKEPTRHNIFMLVMLLVSAVLTLIKIGMFVLYKTKFRNRLDRIILKSRRYSHNEGTELNQIRHIN